MSNFTEKLINAIWNKQQDNNGKNLFIYINDLYYVQIQKEIYELGLIEIDTHEQLIMGCKYYRVSPNDKHPDFRIFVEEGE